MPQKKRTTCLENKKSKSLSPPSSSLWSCSIKEVKQPLPSASACAKKDEELVTNFWSDDEIDYSDHSKEEENLLKTSATASLVSTASIMTEVFNNHNAIILNYEHTIVPVHKQ